MAARRKAYSLKYVERMLSKRGWKLIQPVRGGKLHMFADKQSLLDHSREPFYSAGGLTLSMEDRSFAVKLSMRAFLKANLHLDLYECLRDQAAFARVNEQAIALIRLSKCAGDIMDEPR